MLIQNNFTPNNSQQKPSFGALKIATAKNFVKGAETSIDIYKLEKKDHNFVEFLEENVDYHKLAPTIRKDLQDRWQKVFRYCIERIKSGENDSFIAVSDNKPCGIFTYIIDSCSAYLDAVCKIPNLENEVHLAGKTMILSFLKSAEKTNSKTVTLDAVKDGPVDVISLYEKLGFKKVYNSIDDGVYQPMEMNKFKLKEQLKNLEKLINYKDIKKSEEINLFDVAG